MKKKVISLFESEKETSKVEEIFEELINMKRKADLQIKKYNYLCSNGIGKNQAIELSKVL